MFPHVMSRQVILKLAFKTNIIATYSSYVSPSNGRAKTRWVVEYFILYVENERKYLISGSRCNTKIDKCITLIDMSGMPWNKYTNTRNKHLSRPRIYLRNAGFRCASDTPIDHGGRQICVSDTCFSTYLVIRAKLNCVKVKVKGSLISINLSYPIKTGLNSRLINSTKAILLYLLFIGISKLHIQAMLGKESLAVKRYLNIRRVRYRSPDRY